MSETAPQDQDPDGAGLQSERTTMAWIRTALTLAGTGALLARQSGSMPVAVVVLVAVALAAGSLVWVAERAHDLRRHALVAGGPVVRPAQVAAAALTATALAGASLVLVIA